MKECVSIVISCIALAVLAADPTGCPDFEVELPRTTLSEAVAAADFGFSVTNDDNAAALNRALAACRERKAARLVLPPGTYRCFGPKGVEVSGLTDFTLEGNGAVLVFWRKHPKDWDAKPDDYAVGSGPNLQVKDCRRTLVRDLVCDWDWQRHPLGFFARVVGKKAEVDGESYVDFKLVGHERYPLYPDPVPVQLIQPMSEDLAGARMDGGGERVYCETAPGMFGSRNEWIAPDTLRVWICVAQPDRPHGEDVSRRFWKGRNRDSCAAFRIGETYNICHHYYGMSGMDLSACEHLTLRNVSLWSCRGHGVGIGDGLGYLSFEKFRLAPPTEAEAKSAGVGWFGPRPYTSTSDGTHCRRSRGHFRFTDCEWTLNNDDCLNFHDCTTIARGEGERTLRVVNSFGTRYLGVSVGHELELLQEDYEPTGWRGKVIAVDSDTMTVDHPLPRQAGRFFVVYDRAYSTDNLLFRNCRFHHAAWARNLILANNVTLERCRFDSFIGSPLRFQTCYTPNVWCEGMGATNIVVRGCTFENCADFYTVEGVSSQIFLGLRLPSHKGWPEKGVALIKDELLRRQYDEMLAAKGALDVKPCGKTVGSLLVERNTFVNPRGSLVYAFNGDGVTVRDNRVVFDGKAPYRLLPDAGESRLDGATGVREDGKSASKAAQRIPLVNFANSGDARGAFLNSMGVKGRHAFSYDARRGCIVANFTNLYANLIVPEFHKRVKRLSGGPVPKRFYIRYRAPDYKADTALCGEGIAPNGKRSLQTCNQPISPGDDLRYSVAWMSSAWHKEAPFCPSNSTALYVRVNGTGSLEVYEMGYFKEEAVDVEPRDPRPIAADAFDVFPKPKEFELTGGELALPLRMTWAADDLPAQARADFCKDLKDFEGIELCAAERGRRPFLSFSLRDDLESIRDDGFSIRADDGGISVAARESAGLGYAALTLADLIWRAGGKRMPKFTLQDWPRIKYRSWDDAQTSFDRISYLPTSFYKPLMRKFAFANRYNRISFWFDKLYQWRHPDLPHLPNAWRRSDLVAVTDYVNGYGLRMMPQVAFPGHQEFLVGERAENVDKYCEEGCKDVLCIRNPESIRLVEDMLDEQYEIFSRNAALKPDFLLSGGDEVRWKRDVAASNRCPRCGNTPRNELFLEAVRLSNGMAKKRAMRNIICTDMIDDSHNGGNIFNCSAVKDRISKETVLLSWSGLDDYAIGDFAAKGYDNWKQCTGVRANVCGERSLLGYGIGIYSHNWWLSATRGSDSGAWGIMAQAIEGYLGWSEAPTGEKDEVINLAKKYGDFLLQSWSRKPLRGKTGERRLQFSDGSVPVGGKAVSFVFTHSVDVNDGKRGEFLSKKNTSDALTGAPVAEWIVEYADGGSYAIAVSFGWNVGDRVSDGTKQGDVLKRYLPDCRRVIPSADDKSVTYEYEWENPYPDRAVRALVLKPRSGLCRYNVDAVSAGVSANGATVGAPVWAFSDDYVLEVDGRRVPVYEAPACHPYAFAPVTAEGEVELAVSGRHYPGTNHTIRVCPPKTIVLEPNGRHGSLVIALSKPESNPPACDNPKVHWFGPGHHHRELIRVGSGETLYLAPGAWVEGVVLAEGKDITICGSGVLSGRCWPWRDGPRDPILAMNHQMGHQMVLRGENIVLRDITLFSPFAWSTVLNSVTNCVIDNYKVVSGRCVNDDGIDCCRVKDVVIRNSFFHTQDDCIAVKWAAERLTVSNCVFVTDVATAVRIGFECERKGKFTDLHFKDLDIRHLAIGKRGADDFWTNGAFLLQAANKCMMKDFLFEDIRVAEFEDGRDEFFVVKTLPIPLCMCGGNGPWVTDDPGFVDGVTIRGVTGPRRFTANDVVLRPADERHPIRNVKIIPERD